MAKLIVSRKGEIVESRFLEAANFTIGSLADNDLCLTSDGVSRSHARITTVGHDAILEDLGSTNGTRVNGQPVTRHILQNDDVIDIADTQIRYRNHKALDGPHFDRTLIIRTGHANAQVAAQPVGAYALATAKKALRVKRTGRQGRVRFIKGERANEEILLTDVLHVFGTPGQQVAVINPRPHGYFITHVEGEKTARLNGRPIGLEPKLLSADDVIEVGADTLRFDLQ